MLRCLREAGKFKEAKFEEEVDASITNTFKFGKLVADDGSPKMKLPLILSSTRELEEEEKTSINEEMETLVYAITETLSNLLNVVQSGIVIPDGNIKVIFLTL
jgi:hypothetical protein